MGRKAEISIETRAVIVALKNERYSTQKFLKKAKVSQTAVMNTLKLTLILAVIVAVDLE